MAGNMQEELHKHRQRIQAIREGRYLSTTQHVDHSSPQVQNTNAADHQTSSNETPTPICVSEVPTASKRASTDSYNTTFQRASLVPPPLRFNPKPAEQSIQHNEAPRSILAPPVRAYGSSASKIKQHFGVDEVTVDFSHIDPLPVKPPAARSTWRSSLNRLSLTPMEMPYPMDALRAAHDDLERGNATEMLGLRRMSVAPPVPPKDPSRLSDASSTTVDTLLLHKKDDDDLEQPLNGRTAWLHSLTGMLVVFNCWGLNNAYGVFQAYYSTTYLPHTSPSAIAWIGSTQLALVFGLGVPVGRLVDKGYFRYVFHGGSLIMIFGLFLSSVCTKLWSLWLVNGLVTGIGMGMCFCAGIVAMMTWFDERKIGAAMALGAAGSCVGGIVYVLLARHFLETQGFKHTMLILGGVAAATMIPPNLVFRVRGQRQKSLRKKQHHETRMTKSKIDWRTFASLAYMLAAAGMFFSFLGVYFGFVYIVSFASTVLHMSDTASTNLLIFMLASNLPGRFLPALISDQCIGPLNTIIPSVFLSSAVIWLWAASGERKGALTVIACFYGFVSAGIQVLYAPTVYSFCLEPARPITAKMSTHTEADTQLAMDRVGIKAGGIFTSIGVACLIGLPIGGALISYRTDRGMDKPYLGAQVFAGVCLLTGGFLLLGSRVAKSGWAARRT